MSSFNVGITGQAGFVGTHLFHYLELQADVVCVPFADDYFDDPSVFDRWVRQCDVIVHLAALNRHNDPQEIYDTNIRLTRQLVESMERTQSRPHVLFSSSVQEERDNPYGKSKLECRKMLATWAQGSGGVFTGLVIPNVFGPFGLPFYNSVVGTFCHQLTHGDTCRIDVDNVLELIYVGELVEVILECVRRSRNDPKYRVPGTAERKVTEIRDLLQQFKEDYFDEGVIPVLHDRFELHLFNTFRCHIESGSHFPVKLTQHTDPRGCFCEILRLGTGGQVSFSTTHPGITRGNHFHTRKIERFAVIGGKANIALRRIGTEDLLSFDLDGSEPAYVDMPIWYTHNITNTGTEDLVTVFWISECYDPADPDTFYADV